MKWGYHLVVFLSFFLPSCEEEEPTPSCADNIASFTGAWNIIEYCGANEYGYRLTITGSGSGKITLSNIGDGGPNAVVEARIEGSSFTIYPQDVQTYTLRGNGSLNADCTQLVLQWAGGPKGDCAATGNR